MPVTELLALVDPDLPRTSSGLRGLYKINCGKATRMRELTNLVRSLESAGGITAQRYIIWAYFQRLVLGPQNVSDSQLPLPLLGDPNELYQALCERLMIVRKALRKFLRPYIPEHLIRALFSRHAEEEPLQDITAIVIPSFGIMPKEWNPSSEERRLSFELQRDCILTFINYDLLKRGKWIGYKRSHEDFQDVAEFLVSQGLLDSIPEHKIVASLHDPGNALRTVWIHGIDGFAPPYQNHLTHRTTKLAFTHLRMEDHAIPVIMQVRRKGFLQTLGKWRAVYTEKKKKTVDVVHDRRGICFAYKSMEELEEGAAFLRKRLPFNQILGNVWEQYHESPGDNPHSASNFRAIAYYRLLCKSPGRRYQLQHRLMSQHIGLVHCRGAENHTLYHLRQYTTKPNGLLYWLFPKSIYGIDWGDATVFEELLHHALASLPA